MKPDKPSASHTFSLSFALSVGIMHLHQGGMLMGSDTFSCSGSIDFYNYNVSAFNMAPPPVTLVHPPRGVSKRIGEVLYTARLEAGIFSSPNGPPDLWSISVTTIPEPFAVVLLGLGGLGVLWAVRAQRRLGRVVKG